MEARDFIALIAIASGALVSIYTIRRASGDRADDRKHSHEMVTRARRDAVADRHREAAIDAVVAAKTLIFRMDPSDRVTFTRNLTNAQFVEVENALEKLALVGWSEEVRKTAQKTHDELVQASAWYIMSRASATAGGDEDSETLAELQTYVEHARDAVYSLSQLIREQV